MQAADYHKKSSHADTRAFIHGASGYRLANAAVKIPPLSIRSLQLSGLLKVQDQLDSEFRLRRKILA